MRREIPVTPIVLGLAPMFAASLEFSIWTAPLCLFLIIAVRAAAKISTEHEIAALHDALTGLPNRTLMLTRLNESLAAVDDDRPGRAADDRPGPLQGDQRQPRSRHRRRVADPGRRPADRGGRPGRHGGPARAATSSPSWSTTPRRTQAEALAQRVTGSLNQSIQLAELTLNVAASVGVAMAPRRDTDAGTLIRNGRPGALLGEGGARPLHGLQPRAGRARGGEPGR